MLTETKIRASKPHEKPYKLRDGKGLHLLITQTGSRLWRFRYRHAGHESMLGLGSYPEVSLAQARNRRDDARKLLAAGSDPAVKRRAERAAQANTFEAVAREWLEVHAKEVSAGTAERAQKRLETFVFPYVGSKPVAQVTAQNLLAPLKRLEAKGRRETAHRTREACSRVLRFAVLTGRAENDVSLGLRGALARPDPASHAAITEPAKIGALLRAIDGYTGDPGTVAALSLAPLLFVRPGELRAAEWAEFDLDAAEWRIPKERMKMGEAHLVPLCTQSVAILRDLRLLTGRGKYLFPSLRTRDRPMSNNTLNAALRRMGYSNEEMTAHGFRAMASTRLNEMGFAPDVIELQLAHKERNKVRAAYNRAQRLDERRKMMQVWADYLEGLKAGGGNIVPLRSSNALRGPAQDVA